MRTLPFLYLPDAVTLILLILVLSELRKVAISHLRQELLILRKEMISFWLHNGLDRADAGYLALRDLIDVSIRLAPRLSPARLLFIQRLQKHGAQQRGSPFPDPASDVSARIGRILNQAGKEKLQRLQTEMSLALGSFFLVGSVSGWALLLLVVPKMVRHSFVHHSRDRADAFFDMTERLLSRTGRRAQQIGFAGQNQSL
jgi:hypothetical protein